jgi:hypothetical protein
VANYSSVNFNGIYFPDYSGLQAQVKPMEKPPKFVTDVVQPEDLGDDWDEAEPEALPVKRRGRPPKSEAVMAVLKSPEEPAKRGPGRPRKQPKDTSGKNLFVDFNNEVVDEDEDWDEAADDGGYLDTVRSVVERVLDKEELKAFNLVTARKKPTDCPIVIKVAGNFYTRRDQLSAAEDTLVDRIAYLEAEETKVRILRDALAAEVKSLTRKLKAMAPPERRMDTKVPILEPAFIVDPEPEDT